MLDEKPGGEARKRDELAADGDRRTDGTGEHPGVDGVRGVGDAARPVADPAVRAAGNDGGAGPHCAGAAANGVDGRGAAPGRPEG